MEIIKKLFPVREKEVSDREEKTRQVVEESKKARRDSEAAVIMSYRRLGLEVTRGTHTRK